MKRNTLKVLSALGLIAVSSVALASCGDDTTTSVSPNTTPVVNNNSEIEDLVKGFDSSINTTVKLTYNAAYNVDVDANGGSANMSSFKHQIRSTTEIEMDLGSDLYIKTKKTSKDLLVGNDETVTEALLYKSGDKYYYETSTSKAQEVVASEARAKVNEIISSVTKEQAGSIDLDTLLYNNLDKSYELSYIGLSDTFVESDLNDPTYLKNSSNGLNVEYKAEYVGYQTDGGISDFSNSTDGYAATLNLETNNKGYVTSWKETYNNASLDFAIMTPAPTVSITGERNFTASYGDSIVKESSLNQVSATLNCGTSTGGTYVVKVCAMGDFQNMTEVTNGDALEVGKVLCIKPTADSGKEVDTVTVNSSTTPLTSPSQAGGFYCFNVIEGENIVSVTFKDAAPVDDTKGTVTIPTINTASVKVYTCAPYGFTSMTEVTNGGEVTVGNWICIKVTAAGNNTITSVKLNGSAQTLTDPSNAGGYYCFTASQTNEITVEVNGTDVFTGDINVTNASNVNYTLMSMVYGQTGPTDYQTITNGKIEPASSKFGCIVVDSSVKVTVTVNGTATTINIPANGVTYYCFAVKTAGTYEVVITLNN